MKSKLKNKLNSTTAYVRGIDVSVYQGSIDWTKVAAAGVKFAIMRASYGITPDDTFATNWVGAKAAKVVRGAYHYFIPTDDVQASAELFIKQVGQLAPGDLAPALDLEDPAAWASIAKSDRVGLVLKWLQIVQQALGVTPMIYCSLNFIGEVFDDASALSAYPLWIAYYEPVQDNNPPIPSIFKVWKIWQWSDKTKVDGIVGDVDGDWFNGTLRAMASLRVKRSRRKARPRKAAA